MTFECFERASRPHLINPFLQDNTLPSSRKHRASEGIVFGGTNTIVDRAESFPRFEALLFPKLGSYRCHVTTNRRKKKNLSFLLVVSSSPLRPPILSKSPPLRKAIRPTPPSSPLQTTRQFHLNPQLKTKLRDQIQYHPPCLQQRPLPQRQQPR